MSSKTITVTGMACGGCEDNVETALNALEGVSSVEADNETNSVELVADGVSDADIRATIEEAGYEVQ